MEKRRKEEQGNNLRILETPVVEGLRLPTENGKQNQIGSKQTIFHFHLDFPSWINPLINKALNIFSTGDPRRKESNHHPGGVLHVLIKGKIKIKKQITPSFHRLEAKSHISEYAAVNLIFLACGGVRDQVTGV